jgi:hypothetical protein
MPPPAPRKRKQPAAPQQPPPLPPPRHQPLTPPLPPLQQQHKKKNKQQEERDKKEERDRMEEREVLYETGKKRLEKKRPFKGEIETVEREGKEKVGQVHKCKHALCKLCKHIDVSDTIEGSLRGRHYTTTSYRRTQMMEACNQSWVVYVVTCIGCGGQYCERQKIHSHNIRQTR